MLKTASSGTQKGTLFGALRNLADEITEEKTAAAEGQVKAGETPTPPDPGGYQGSSTHPTTNVDNSAQTATEGARSSENTSDVKADQKEPAVDNTSEATPNQDEQDSVQLNIGTQQSATGEDPSVEDDYKGEKDDPGSSMPARTDNNPEKYGSLSFKEAHDRSNTLANEILADLANGFGEQLEKGAESSDPKSRPETSAPMTPAGGSAEGEHVEPGGGGATTSEKKEKEGAAPQGIDPDALKQASAAVQPQQQQPAEMQAGYELAQMLGISKEAAANGVAATIAETIKDAQVDADLFGSYYKAYLEKQSAVPPDEEGGEAHENPSDASSGAGEGAEPMPEDMGGEMPPEMGGGEGPSLGDILGPGGEEGGMEGGMGMEGMPGGEPSEEEAVAELAAALDELGIPLEALAEAGGAPAEGGMPPEGGMGMPPEGGMGMPPEGMEVAASANGPTEGQKLASAIQRFKQSGQYRFKQANDGTRARAIRDIMKGYLQEIMG